MEHVPELDVKECESLTTVKLAGILGYVVMFEYTNDLD